MPYEEFEHHDFNDDTLDAQPSGTVRYGDASSWLVKAEGPGGEDLANAVVVNAGSGNSYLLFSHSGTGDDLHNYPDRIIVCCKFDTTKAGRFVVGFNLNTTSHALMGVYLTPSTGAWGALHITEDGVYTECNVWSESTVTIDSDTWYVIDLFLWDGGAKWEATIAPLDDQEDTTTADGHASGYDEYADYTDNPHACLAHIGAANVKCCWHYMSTYETPGAEGYPVAPSEDVTGDGAVEWNLDHESGTLQLNNDWYVQSPDDEDSWVEKETHDFSLDTVGQVPQFTVAVSGDWEITEDGPTEELTNCVYINDTGTGSELRFFHEYADPDRDDKNCDAIILVKLSKSYTNRNARFRFQIQLNEATESYYLEIDTYGGVLNLYYYISSEQLVDTASWTFDADQWYCLRLQSFRNLSRLRAKIWTYGYAQPSTWQLEAFAVPAAVGNPHVSLLVVDAAMEASCAWMSVTNGSITGEVVPDPPPNLTEVDPILGTGEITFPDFTFETGQNWGVLDFADFFIGEAIIANCEIEVDISEQFIYVGFAGAITEVEFSPIIAATGSQRIRGTCAVLFPTAAIASTPGAKCAVIAPSAVVSAGGKQSVLGDAAITFPAPAAAAIGTNSSFNRSNAALNFPSLVHTAHGYSSIDGVNAVAFPLFRILSSGLISSNGDGDVTAPDAVIASTGFNNPRCAGAIDFEFDVESYGSCTSCYHKLLEFER